MHNYCSKFFESNLFILLIGTLTMLCWYINSLYVTASIFGIILILELIFKSKLYSFPSMLGLVFAGYKKYSMSFKDYGLYVMIGILLLAIILFTIRFIQKRHYIKQRIKSCSILYTTMLLAIPMLVSIINSPVKPITFAHTALWLLNAIIILAVLYGIPNTDEAKEKVCFAFVMLMYVIGAQIIIGSINSIEKHGFENFLKWKSVDIGWNLTNHAVIGINIGVISAGYLFVRNKNKLNKTFMIISAVLGLALNFFVACRGGILGIGVCGLLLAIIACIIYRKQWKMLLLSAVMIGCILGIAYIFISYTEVGKALIAHFTKIGFNDNGRDRIYEFAINLFKDNKLIGTGWGSSAYYLRNVLGDWVTNYHNWFLQMLTTCGIFGVVCLGIYLIDIFRLKKYQYKDSFTWIVFVIVLYFLVHGMVDTVLFSKNFHFFLTIVVAMIKLPKEEIVQRVRKEKYIILE